MRAFLISALRSGLRGHSFHAVFLLGLLLIGGAYLAALFSPRQPETVALDVGLSGIRFALVLMAVFWVQELVGKEIERRTTIQYLAYPIHRAQYILGRFSGITILLLVATITLALLLWILVIASSTYYAQSHPGALGYPFWITIIGVWLDVVVVAAFTLCIAALSTVPALPLVLGIAFALAGHTLGAVMDYLARGADGQDVLTTTYAPMINVVRWLVPDLSRLDWRIWPMYDLPMPSGSIMLAFSMAAGYVTLMLCIAVHLFSRREFD